MKPVHSGVVLFVAEIIEGGGWMSCADVDVDDVEGRAVRGVGSGDKIGMLSAREMRDEMRMKRMVFKMCRIMADDQTADHCSRPSPS